MYIAYQTVYSDEVPHCALFSILRSLVWIWFKAKLKKRHSRSLYAHEICNNIGLIMN